MEDIIRRIIAIEDSAQEIVKDAREAEENLNKRVENADKRIAKKIHDKAEKRCRTMRDDEQAQINEKIELINARTDAQLQELQKKYGENKEKWVNDMIRHIIGE